MNDLTPQQLRAVAEHYRVNGWEPGQMCDRAFRTCRHGRGDAILLVPHELPPPNILEPAGAWALLVALWERKDIAVEFNLRFVSIWNGRPEKTAYAEIKDSTLPAALARAAYEAIPEESR